MFYVLGSGLKTFVVYSVHYLTLVALLLATVGQEKREVSGVAAQLPGCCCCCCCALAG